MKATYLCVLVLCFAAFAYSAPVIKTSEKDEKCTVCEFLVTIIEQYLAKGMNPSEIEKELDALCSRLPGEFGHVCHNIVASPQLHLIITELTNGTSPHLVCSQAHLCTTVMKVVRDEKCTVCEFMVTIIEQYLAKGMSPAQIEKELHALCGRLPGTMGAICNNIVSSGDVHLIITELTNGTSPHVVCSQVHLCTALEKIPKGEEECKVCELVTGLVESYLLKGMSAAQIIAELKKVCAMLPSALSGICDDFVTSGIVTKIIDELTNGTAPHQVCTQLHLCSTFKLKNQPMYPYGLPLDSKKVKGEEECKVCELVTGLVESYLLKGMSASQIIAELKKVCAKLPSALSGICDDFVSSGMVTKIITELTNGTPPHQVCTQLHLCATLLAPKLTPKEIECDVCKLAVSLAEYYIKTSNLTTDQIEKELEKVCDYFGKEKAFCVATIMVEAPKIINALKSGMPPAKVCASIKLCASEEPQPLQKIGVKLRTRPF